MSIQLVLCIAVAIAAFVLSLTGRLDPLLGALIGVLAVAIVVAPGRGSQ